MWVCWPDFSSGSLAADGLGLVWFGPLSPPAPLSPSGRERGAGVHIGFFRFGWASTGVVLVGLPASLKNCAVAATASGFGRCSCRRFAAGRRSYRIPLALGGARGKAPRQPLAAPGGAVAEATKSNVAVRSPFPPRWGWKGGWGDRGVKTMKENAKQPAPPPPPRPPKPSQEPKTPPRPRCPAPPQQLVRPPGGIAFASPDQNA